MLHLLYSECIAMNMKGCYLQQTVWFHSVSSFCRFHFRPSRWVTTKVAS